MGLSVVQDIDLLTDILSQQGVRHTLFEESRSLEGATDLLTIYDTFAVSEIEHDLPQDAYISLLSPALSARQLRILGLLFEMCSNVAMYAEVTGTSGMPSSNG